MRAAVGLERSRSQAPRRDVPSYCEAAPSTTYRARNPLFYTKLLCFGLFFA